MGVVDVDYLPAPLHNQPAQIVPSIEAKLAGVDPERPVFLGYADCGTGGLLDDFIERSDREITRLPGAHCYEFFAGAEHFAALHDADPGTFYLTDFLVKHFDRLIITGLGIDRHPQLLDDYFGNYNRLIYLAQTDDPDLVMLARRAADRLGLAFELHQTGYGDLEPVIVALSPSPGAST